MRRQNATAGLSEHRSESFFETDGVWQQLAADFGLAEVDELHEADVLQHRIVQGLRVVLADEGGCHLEFIEHLIDHEVEIVGLLKAAVSHRDRNLGMRIKALGPQTSCQIVFIDALVEETAKLIMNSISTAHHNLVDLRELLVGHGVQVETGDDGHK